MPEAPTPREAMAAMAAGDALGSLVLPKFPYVPIPKRVLSAFPELEDWNRHRHEQEERWREQVNSVIASKTGG